MTDRAWIDDLASRSIYTRETILAIVAAMEKAGYPEEQLESATATCERAYSMFGWSDEQVRRAKAPQRHILGAPAD